ncbi:MAG TPA: hypothetical protein VK604_17910 [Bryobacteraceae bacterium]|nr:hypothetical protein [Bryobacteraceae bacterium]
MAASPPVVMKLLIVAWDANDISYQALTRDLGQIGLPYQAIFVNNLTPDGSGNRLSGVTLVDSATGRGLYQGIIQTDSSFDVCTDTCTRLLSLADVAKLNNYATQYSVRMVCYYGWPDAAWGLQPGDSGASYTAANPLNVTLTAAGAAVFSYLAPTATIPVFGQGGGIWAYKALPTASANETTTPLLAAGSYTVGVTHKTADGRETMALAMDNYPGYIHSTAFGYGVLNWVTKGVFLGYRRVYLNPQIDDLLNGNLLYAPTLSQCPNGADPSCPRVFTTGDDLIALANWQTNLRSSKPQFSTFHSTFAVNGVGTEWFPPTDPVFTQIAALDSQFTWITHTYDHANLDCYAKNSQGVCVPATLAQSQAELNQIITLAPALGMTLNRTDMVTPFNGGLTNPDFLQAAVQAGIQNIVTVDEPPTPQIGVVNPLNPSIFQITRRDAGMYVDVSSPLVGAYGSWPDEYNSVYGPSGTNPTYSQDQTYSQIIDIESDKILNKSMLMYEPYSLAFHIGNSHLYDDTHSMYTDLMDATIVKYTRLFSLPVLTLDMKDVAPVLKTRASFNNSGVVGVYTPGVSVVLTTNNVATIPITGACSQAACSSYAGQIQDNVSMAAHSTVTLSLSALDGIAPASVSLNPASVAGGSSSTGTVTLTGAAPAGGASISLSSDNSAATVPSSVTVPAGGTSATFTVATTAVGAPATATIIASYNSADRTAALTITAPTALSTVSLNPTSVVRGTSSTGTVTLGSAAPTGGISVALSSNNAAATVPASVTVAAGSTTANFTVTTTAGATAATATITATYSGVSKTAALTMTVATALSTVSLNPASVVRGTSSTGTVTLSSAAPTGGIAVALSSNNTAATVPASVIVAAGSTTASFTVTTTAGTTAATATITATYSGVSKPAALTMTIATALSTVSLNPTSVVRGTSSTGTVTLSSAAPTGGTAVALSSNNAAATVPASVTVAAGSTTANFTVTTTAGTTAATATITATYSGVSKTAALTITVATALSTVSLNPASVTRGATSTGTVTLSSAAPSGGISVALSSNNAAAIVPATVTIAAGGITATFTVTTTLGTAAATATIIATYTGVSKTAALTMTASAALSSVALSPASVTRGSASTGTVTLSKAAPTSGISVALSSNNAAAMVPATVTVAAGSTTATFTVTTTAGTTAATATITATYNGVSKTSTLAMTGPTLLSSLSVAPTRVAGGTAATGTITLSTPAPVGGVSISLKTINTVVTGVPASITIPAGSTTATFAVTTRSFLITWQVTLTATQGATNKTASLTVTP